MLTLSLYINFKEKLVKKGKKNRLKRQILSLIKKKKNTEAGLLMQRYKSIYGELEI